MMLPFFSVPSFLCSLIPLFLLFCPSLHPSFLYSFSSPILPYWMGVLCNTSSLFLSQNKINLSTLHFSLPQSLTCPPPPPHPFSALFLWPSSSSETTGELLLKSTDRSTVKRNKRKDRFFLLKPQKLARKKRRPVTTQEGITFWPLIIQRDREGGGGRKGRERERSSQGFYSTTSHVYCYLFTAFLVFLCLSCPPSERVLFSLLLVIEGGRKQTQIKA